MRRPGRPSPVSRRGENPPGRIDPGTRTRNARARWEPRRGSSPREEEASAREEEESPLGPPGATWAATRDGPEVLVPIVDPRTTPTARTRTACRVDTSSVRVARARRRTVAARRGGTRTFARRRLPTVRYSRGRADPDAARARARRRLDEIRANRRAPGGVSSDGRGRWTALVATRDGVKTVRARFPKRSAPFAGAPLAPTRVDVGDPSGPGPDGPGLVREQRAARGGLVDDPDRPTWRERASEYILAGGGDGGAGGRRRGPHEREDYSATDASVSPDKRTCPSRVRTTCSRRMPAPLDPTEVFARRGRGQGGRDEPKPRATPGRVIRRVRRVRRGRRIRPRGRRSSTGSTGTATNTRESTCTGTGMTVAVMPSDGSDVSDGDVGGFGAFRRGGDSARGFVGRGSRRGTRTRY